MTELLDIVNDNDEVIGQIERDDLDKAKHLFRMIFIAYYTPDKRIILQLRSMIKKNNPGKLTTTVSGHVESGMSYDETAIKEGFEESGVEINPDKLHHLGVFRTDAMRAVYAYPYDGEPDDLMIEDGEGAGFIAMPIPELRQERINNPDQFTQFVRSGVMTKLIDYIETV